MFSETTLRISEVVTNSTFAAFSVPVRELADPTDQHAYGTNNMIFLPRWTYLLFQAKYDPYAALKLLEQRYIDDVDRRLKEKNL